MYVSVGNSYDIVILYELPKGKLVGVVERVDVRGCIVCTLHVMYVSVGNSQEYVLSEEPLTGKLVSVVKRMPTI